MKKRYVGIICMVGGVILFALTTVPSQNFVKDLLLNSSDSVWGVLLPYGIAGTLLAWGIRFYFETSTGNKPASQVGIQSVWADKEKLHASISHLSKNQQTQIRSVSWGALVNPFVWSIANRQRLALLLLLIPGVNLIVWLLLFVNGRQIAWLAKVEPDADQFARREREVLVLSLILTCCLGTISLLAQ